MTAIDERAVAETLRNLYAGADDATDALTAFGIDEFLAEDLPTSVRHLFSAQGQAGARSNALASLLSFVLRRHAPDPDGAVALGADDQPLVFGNPERIVVAHRHALVLLEAEERRLAPVRGIDPDLGLHRVLPTGEGRPLLKDEAALAALEEVTAWARMALAWELVGGCRAALALTGEHAAVREQFGRPIGQFQAVAHRLAEVRVAIDAAEAVAGLVTDPLEPMLAATGKFLAGRAFEVTAKNCLQVLGGIGFTTEHPFDRYARRGFALDQLFGSRVRLAAALGTELFERGNAPLLCTLDRSSA
jgi:hypothetical protein